MASVAKRALLPGEQAAGAASLVCSAPAVAPLSSVARARERLESSRVAAAPVRVSRRAYPTVQPPHLAPPAGRPRTLDPAAAALSPPRPPARGQAHNAGGRAPPTPGAAAPAPYAGPDGAMEFTEGRRPPRPSLKMRLGQAAVARVRARRPGCPPGAAGLLGCCIQPGCARQGARVGPVPVDPCDPGVALPEGAPAAAAWRGSAWTSPARGAARRWGRGPHAARHVGKQAGQTACAVRLNSPAQCVPACTRFLASALCGCSVRSRCCVSAAPLRAGQGARGPARARPERACAPRAARARACARRRRAARAPRAALRRRAGRRRRRGAARRAARGRPRGRRRGAPARRGRGGGR